MEYSPVRHARLEQFYEGWQAQLRALDFDGLSREGQIDWILLRNRVRFDREMLALERRRWEEIAWLFPFASGLRALEEGRLNRQRARPRASGGVNRPTLRSR